MSGGPLPAHRAGVVSLLAAACQGDSIGAAIIAIGGFAMIGFIVWVAAR